VNDNHRNKYKIALALVSLGALVYSIMTIILVLIFH